jgi:hypothetical protein
MFGSTCNRYAEDRYIVQKYIETALIVRRRKFDIRQWVLVTVGAPVHAESSCPVALEKACGFNP